MLRGGAFEFGEQERELRGDRLKGPIGEDRVVERTDPGVQIGVAQDSDSVEEGTRDSARHEAGRPILIHVDHLVAPLSVNRAMSSSFPPVSTEEPASTAPIENESCA